MKGRNWETRCERDETLDFSGPFWATISKKKNKKKKSCIISLSFSNDFNNELFEPSWTFLVINIQSKIERYKNKNQGGGHIFLSHRQEWRMTGFDFSLGAKAHKSRLWGNRTFCPQRNVTTVCFQVKPSANIDREQSITMSHQTLGE